MQRSMPMRLWFGLLALAACSTFGADAPTDAPSEDTEDTCRGGGLPPPTCGSGPCTCCTSCSQADGLCLDPGWGFELGIGRCRAQPAAGSLAMTIGATPFTAIDVAAGVDPRGMMEISARAGAASISFIVPATVGTYDCATSPYVMSLASYDGAGGHYRNRPTNGARPGCTIDITAIGAVGERIDGTFAATLLDQSALGGPMLELTAGTFSVERGAYP